MSFVGIRLSLKVALPVLPASHFWVQLSLALVRNSLLAADVRVLMLSGVGAEARGSWAGFSRHPVASLAAMSAASFPGPPSCAAIQWISISLPQLAMRWASSFRMHFPD